MMTYSRTETFEYPNCTVTVHYPDLTKEEREKRFNELKKAAEHFLKEVERMKHEH